MSSCRAALYREPRKPAASCTFHPARRSSTMHLKPYPKFQKKDLPLEMSQDSLRGLHPSQQGALRTERRSNACVTRQPCSPGGLHGNGTGKRRPFGVLSTNTMCNSSSSSSAGPKPSGESLCARARKSRAASLNSITGSLLLLSTASENDDSFNIHRGDEAEGPLDIWAVIKPGNTKEKIAIFAAQRCSASSDSSSVVNSSSAGNGNSNLNSSSISVSFSNGNGSNSSSPSNRTVLMKIRGSWEVEGSVAKRRKRSADPDALKTPEQQQPPQPQPNGTRDYGAREVGRQSDSVVIEGEGGEDGEGGKALSVVEMVAYLEQRASDLLTDCTKHCPVRGSGCVGQSKGGTAVEQQSVSESSEESQGDCVRVLEMVAKLESECLKRQCEREASGGLSRNNSLRRNVGRVLLATGQAPPLSMQQQQEPESDPQQPPYPQQGQSCLLEESPDKSIRKSPKKNGVCCETPGSETASSVFRTREGSSCCDGSVDLTGPPRLDYRSKGCSEEGVERQGERRRGEEGCAGESSYVMKEEDSGVRAGLKQERREEEEPHVGHREEQIPGMLFFRQTPSSTVQDQLSQPPAAAAVKKEEEEEEEKAEKEESRELEHSMDSAPQRDSTPAELPPPLSGEVVETDSEGASQQRETFPLRRLVSHEFLEMRFKIQQLLEPQQYMAFLPHHIMVQIFRFLPTETLAALKCTCRYFQFIIESYNVRPADSRWVCDPRYRDDPCKQCKKRYGRGDVSLCRWHPKPYCQALPYGPGYWMCCHGSQKDAAGCSVGLHDNRWVPAFHSLNMPIYKRVRGAEENTS